MLRVSTPIPDLVQHPVVLKIANKHKRTTAQVLLKYLTELGIAVIPKSINPDRIRVNIEVQFFILYILFLFSLGTTFSNMLIENIILLNRYLTSAFHQLIWRN